MPSSLAIAVAPRPCAFISRTWAASIEAERPLPAYTHLALTANPVEIRSNLRGCEESGDPIGEDDDPGGKAE
jgi:hypothetical protein